MSRDYVDYYVNYKMDVHELVSYVNNSNPDPNRNLPWLIWTTFIFFPNFQKENKKSVVKFAAA